MRQTFRYFFDCGSGICLWSDEGGVMAEELPLSSVTRQRILEVDNLYRAVTMEDRSGKKRSLAQRGEFVAAAGQLLDRIRLELGSEYEVVDALNVDDDLPIEQFCAP